MIGAMRKARLATLLVAIVALLLLLLSGPGTKHGWWPWQLGLGMYRFAAWAGIAGAVMAVALIIALAVPRYRVGIALPVVALCMSLAAAAPPFIMLSRAKTVPPIHDITTDFTDPPQFVALMPARDQSPNGAKYGGEAVAAQQRQAYQDIHPQLLSMPPQEATQRALDAARALGWEIIASDAAAGRIEATDTTGWFGFKDDIVIRVRADPAGSRVDLRSASRVGRSDIGANAARVRAFLTKLS
jgi:uncharacterized protein (DUF1499 family)